MHIVRAAIVTRLSGAIMYGSPAAAVPVYDEVPQGTLVGRYIALAETTEEPWNTDTSRGARVRTRIEVYSGYKGSKEAGEIAALVRTRLHRHTFTLSGADFINCEASDGDYDSMSDATTRRAVVDCVFLVDNIT